MREWATVGKVSTRGEAHDILGSGETCGLRPWTGDKWAGANSRMGPCLLLFHWTYGFGP